MIEAADASAVVVGAMALAVPVRVAFDVIPSVDDDPVALATRAAWRLRYWYCRSVKVSDALAVLPAASVSLATTVCEPLPRPVGVKLQAPDASAVAVGAMALPSIVK